MKSAVSAALITGATLTEIKAVLSYCFLDLPWKTLILFRQAIFTFLGHFDMVFKLQKNLHLF